MDDLRLERAKLIAKNRQLRKAANGTWIVLSQTRPGTRYTVNPIPGTCSCPDYAQWELPCKHLYAVKMIDVPEPPNADRDAPKPVDADEVKLIKRKTYPQDWSAYNAAQIGEKETFQLLLRSLCDGIACERNARGRPRLPLSDVLYASVLKVYTTVSGRRASTDIRECEKKGHLRHAPHHNSISDYLRREDLTPVLKQLIEISAAPLKAVEKQFAVDGTGFSTCTYARWFDHRYGEEKRQQIWIKAHAMIGTKTNIVTAVEITQGEMHDSPQFAGLVKATAQRFDVQEVSADKAYMSHRNLDAVGEAGGMAYIPFKSNHRGAGPELWRKLWHLFWYRRDEFEKHYHQRSNVESTFSAIKRKFGGALRSKDLVSQTNECLCKILAFNITVLIHEMHELGIKIDFAEATDVA